MFGRRGRVGAAAAAPVAAAGPAESRLGNRFVMQERLFAFGNDFYITDERGARAFWVDGKALRVRESLSFKDMRGNELYRIQEKMLRVRDSMSLYAGNRVVAQVHKALLTPFRDRLDIEMPGRTDMRAQGKLLYHEYRIMEGGVPIAVVSKRWFRVRDSYGVEVAPKEDALLILALTVCVDMLCHEGR